MTETDKIRFSYSSLSTFNHCEKQFYYRYVRQLESNSDKWRSVKDLGTAIHEGIAELLKFLCTSTIPTGVNTQIVVATDFALKSHDNLVEQNRMNWQGDPDGDYYTEMAYNREIIPHLLHMYIPMMELGSRYIPAMKSDFYVLADGEEDVPLVEYEWSTVDVAPDGRHRPIQGIVDAVLYDKEAETFILYDWKVRGRLLLETIVAQDLQLPMYATVLNSDAVKAGKMENQITICRMFQMLRTPPKPAKLTKKNLPSKSACASYWDYWWNSIPLPVRRKLNHDMWHELMVEGGKLRKKEDWVGIIDTPIVWHTMEEVSNFVEGTLNRIERSALHNDWLPSWSAHNCEFCQFKALCQARRTGADEEEVISLSYQ